MNIKSTWRYLLASTLIATAFASCHPNNNPPATLDNYEQTNLVGSNAGYNAVRTDPNFTGAWGFDFSPFGPAFISSNNTGTSVVFGTAGDLRRDPISIPGVGELPETGQPAGVIFNQTNFFRLPTNASPARFLYAGTDGIITGWNADDDAVIVVDQSATAGFTGLTIAQNGGLDYLYVANFKEGIIQVFDGTFGPVAMTFNDPSLPAGYAPYNITQIDGQLYVTYARRSAAGEVVPGAGAGYVNVFGTDGTFARRFASAGNLNAPWGVVRANAVFWGSNTGSPNALLIGNYGDGRINSYSSGGTFEGAILSDGNPVSIAGLREIRFAPDSAVAEQGKLFFTASGSGTDGLFGYLLNVTEP